MAHRASARKTTGAATPVRISCTACNVFTNPGGVNIPDDPTKRLVQCGVCHQAYYRPNADSPIWQQIFDSEEVKRLGKEHETLWV